MGAGGEQLQAGSDANFMASSHITPSQAVAFKVVLKEFLKGFKTVKDRFLFLSILVSNFETFAFYTKTFSPRRHHLHTFKSIFTQELKIPGGSEGRSSHWEKRESYGIHFSNLKQIKAIFPVFVCIIIIIRLLPFYSRN